MSRNIALVLIAAWLVLLTAVFIHYQFSPFVVENRAPGYISASLSVLFLLLAALSFGLRLLRAEPSRRGCVQGLAVGLGALALAGLALGVLGILHPVAVWLLLAGLLILSYRQLLSVLARVVHAGGIVLHPIECAFIALMVIASAVALVNCLPPITANDSLVYHLNLAKIYCAEGAMVRLPFNVYANMPHYGEVLYSVAFSIAGETGVSMLYFALINLGALAVYVLLAGSAERRFAIAAASAFLVQPLVLDHRVAGNIDILLAFILLGAMGIVLQGDWTRRARRKLILVSALAGIMMGIKYTGVAASAMLLAVLLLLRGRDIPRKRIALGCAIALAAFMPWLVRNGLGTGNPVYPVFEGLFDGRNWDSVQSEQLLSWQRDMGMGRGASDYVALPFNVSVKGRPGLNYSHFDGTISPAMLMLFPLAFIRRRRKTLVLAIAAAILSFFWALTSQQLRFLLPALGLFAVVGGLALENVRGPGRGSWARYILLAVLVIEVITLAVPNQYGRPWVSDAVGERFSVVLGLEPRDRFLERTVQPFSLYRYVDSNLPPGEPVFMVWENRAYHLNRPYFADSFFEASTVMRLVARAADAQELRDAIVEMGYSHVLVNDLLGEVFARHYPRNDISKLRNLIEVHLEPVHSANRMVLYRIKPDSQ